MIPKITPRKLLVLSDGLERMGVQLMFNQSADFSPITTEKRKLWITKHIGNFASMQVLIL